MTVVLLAILIAGRFGIAGAESSSSSSASTTVFFVSGPLVTGCADGSFVASADFCGLFSDVIARPVDFQHNPRLSRLELGYANLLDWSIVDIEHLPGERRR